MTIDDVISFILTILTERWFNSILVTIFILIMILLLDLWSQSYADIVQLNRHSEGQFYTAFFPSRNYLDLMFKLQMADPIRLTITLSKEIKKILRMHLDVDVTRTLPAKKTTKLQDDKLVVTPRQALRNPVYSTNLKKMIESLPDDELRLFLLHPIHWARKYLKPPPKLSFINYFKIKHLIENVDDFSRVLEKIRKTFGFQEPQLVSWSDELKTQSLIVLKRKYYKMMMEDAMRGIGATLFIGLFVIITIIFIIIAYLSAPAFFILLVSQLGLFVFLFFAVKLLNYIRLRRIKRIALTEHETARRLDAHQRTKEDLVEDQDLIQLRYF